MPIYEYTCSNCKHKFELLRTMSQSGESVLCPDCQGIAQRILSRFAACSRSAEGEFNLGGSSCGTCSSSSCSSCSLG